MAKNITIAKLDIDTQALTESLQRTEKDIEKLTEKQDKLIKKGKESSDRYKENAAELNTLIAAHQSLSNALSASEKTFDDYKQQVADSFQQINILNGGLGGFVGRAQEAGGMGSLIKDSFSGMTDGIKGMGLAIKANPLGLLLTAVQAAIDVFKNFTPIVEKVEQAMAAVGAVVETLTNAFIGLFTGDAANFFSNITTGAANAAKEAANLKKEQQELNKEMELEEVNAQKTANRLDELRRKSEDMTLSEKDRAKAVKDLGIEEEKAYNTKVKRSNAEYDMAVKALANGANLTQKEKQRLQEEGFAYLQKLQNVKKFSDEEIEVLKKAEKKKAEIANEGIARQKQADKEYADYLEKQKQDREKRQQEEQSRRQKQRDQEQQKIMDNIENQKLELELLIENQGIKEKAMKNELEYAEKVAERRKNINLAVFNATKKTKNDELKRDIEYAKITKELAEANKNVAIKNAEEVRNNFIENNQSKLKDGQLLNEETVNSEKKRLDDILKANKIFQEEKLKQGAISQQQYDKEIAALDAANTKAKEALDTKKEEERKAKQAIDLENKRAADTINFDYDLNEQLQRLNVQMANEIEAAEKTGADKTLIEKKYAKLRTDTETTVMNNKLNLASQTFGNLATIMGKESAAGKAMAVAQATIDTFQAANKALAAYPPPFNYVAAGAVVATGLGNVKKITSTKPPKAEKGALFNIGGKRHSAGGTLFTGADGTQFEAEKGELIGVMNRNAARHFMAFNNAFPAGGASAPNYFAGGGIVSREIAQQNLNMDELALKIAEANRNLPAPVVAVQDIITEGNSYVRVRDAANF